MSLKLKKISKKFNSRSFFKKSSSIVLDNINLELSKGDILGISGPNGAGKTTLFKIILGLIEPSDGVIELDDRQKKYLAYVNTNSRSFYWRLSVRDNLIFYGKLLNLSDNKINFSIKNLSKRFEVESLLEIPFMKLSSGQMQSMLIIRSLLKKPDFLIFDEATSSMDMQKSNKTLYVIKKIINENDIPTIWCSHDIEEIDLICNRFSILDNGKLRLLEADEFKKFKKNTSIYCFEIKKSELNKLLKLKKFKILKEFNSTYLLRFEDRSIELNDCLKVFFDCNVDIIEIVIQKNMEQFTYA